MAVLELLVRLLNVKSFDMGVVLKDWCGACIESR